MKTHLSIIVFLLFLGTLCKAQEMPVSPKNNFLHHELSIGYGFLPISDGQSMVEETIFPVLSFGAYQRKKTNYYGALNINYMYRFNRKINLGVTGGITGNKGYRSSVYTDNYNIKDNRFYLYILPTFRYHWFTRPNFSLYSSVGLGAYFLNNTINDKVYHRTRFAYQVNFLGIEYGKRFAFFTEFGIGYTGAIMIGGRYRF
nr:outer membrane beta-barrel protein [uncultured Bacteroides sp.]